MNELKKLIIIMINHIERVIIQSYTFEKKRLCAPPCVTTVYYSLNFYRVKYEKKKKKIVSQKCCGKYFITAMMGKHNTMYTRTVYTTDNKF